MEILALFHQKAALSASLQTCCVVQKAALEGRVRTQAVQHRPFPTSRHIFGNGWRVFGPVVCNSPSFVIAVRVTQDGDLVSRASG